MRKLTLTLCLLCALSTISEAQSSSTRPRVRPAGSVTERKPNPRGPFARLTAPVHVDADSLVAHSRALLGVPYLWAGASPERGVDCSGLVQYVFGRFGLSLPHSAAQLATLGESVPSDTSAMRPGDLMVFSTRQSRRISHVGIYVGAGRMIHASSVRRQVVEVNVANYRGLALRDVRRVVALAGPLTGPPATPVSPAATPDDGLIER
jgi:cell wall-associated NlpC family hydrolase